ncbi:MAG: phosphoribulokinase [Gammaproteobacteria bacterium]|nr:phosphoribulokinase [Gammaproteobacteria bacterium]
MSVKHPIVAIAGASGAGTTAVQQAFREIFFRQGINAAFVEGDSFFKYELPEMCKLMDKYARTDKPVSCYGPELNDFSALENLFREYSTQGTGRIRHLVTEEKASLFDTPVGHFTPWENIADNADLLFYEGMHGGVVANTWARRKSDQQVAHDRRKNSGNEGVNVAQYVDLLIGVVPAINLEWIQKIHNEKHCRKKSIEDATHTILERLQDYIHYIVPQFSLTDINFQRMPVVDTSNPFIARDIPTESESVIVVRFREPAKYNFTHYLDRINGSFMSRANTLVIPGGAFKHALDVICAPILEACCKSKLR